MLKFINNDFLLDNPFAKLLYNDYASSEPIFDFHCHLEAKDIYEDKAFSNLADLWLEGDHYKWRAERANGIDEQLITGQTNPYKKYLAFAKTLMQMPGNPLFHWSHLELFRYFGIDDVLNEKSAKLIWNKCQEQFDNNNLSPRYFIEKSGVSDLFTTNNPSADLVYHEKLKSEGWKVSIRPAWRPDNLIYIHKENFFEEIEMLRKVTGISIDSFNSLCDALIMRMDAFEKAGCRASDHSFSAMPFSVISDKKLAFIFKRRLERKELAECDYESFRTMLMLFMAEEYHRRGWAMELHLGCNRDQNSMKVREIGEACGFDGIGDSMQVKSLVGFLDILNKHNILPKTVLFNLNPKDNYALAAIAGSFQEGNFPSKMQFGTAWWFLDHIDGIEEQLKCFSALGVIGQHIGMLTDSRSYVSFARHDYFRRIVCRLFGKWIQDGLYPPDIETLGGIVKNISYKNAKRYFDGGSKENA